MRENPDYHNDINSNNNSHDSLTEEGETVIPPAERSPLSGTSIVKNLNSTLPMLVSVTSSLITLS